MIFAENFFAMDRFYIQLLIISTYVLLIVIIVVLYLCYRASQKERNRNCFNQICEQTRLARELEKALIENCTLEKIIRSAMGNKSCENPENDSIRKDKLRTGDELLNREDNQLK